MKIVRIIFGLMAAGLLAGCFEKSNTNSGTSATILYRHHFLGTSKLAQTTNNAQLPAILALPATRDLAGYIAQKISRSPQQLWRDFLPAGAIAQPELFRPLLDDLFSAESYAEVHGPLHRGESIFAIELPEERAGLWRTNLGAIVNQWKLGKPIPLALGAAGGWEIKRSEAPALFQFIRAGKWVLIGVGQEGLTLLPAWREQIRKTGRPVALQPNVPLDIEADFPRLAQWLPAAQRAKLPPARLTLNSRGNYLRTELRLLFSEPLPWTYEPWRIPTNVVGDPLISFTAARGIAPLLSRVKGLSELGLKPLPNQFCAWGPDTIHMDAFLTTPIGNASNILFEIGPKLPDFFTGLLSQSIGGFTLVSNRYEVIWTGWPVFVPHLLAVHDSGTNFLMAGLFPLRLGTNRPPPELFAQLKGRTNLVYYDWEITQGRLTHDRQLQQLWDIANQRRTPSTNLLSQMWLLAIGPHLTNTITELSLTSPRELTMVRKSEFMFTGIELVALGRWIESAGFPWTFDPPPALSSRTNNLPSNSTSNALPTVPKKR